MHNSAPRNRLIAKIKIGQKGLGLDDEAYRDTLERLTGKRSASKLSFDQLKSVAQYMQDNGAFGETSADRPTRQQQAKMAALAKCRGWEGLDSEELKSFIIRTAKISSPRFLTRRLASKVITGLENWNRQEGIQ